MIENRKISEIKSAKMIENSEYPNKISKDDRKQRIP